MGITLRASTKVPLTTPVVMATPSLVQSEIREGEPNLPPSTSIVGGAADTAMTEGDTSAGGEEDVDRRGDHSPVFKERPKTTLDSPAPVIPEQHAQPAISTSTAAGDGAPDSLGQASAISEAQLAERR